MALLRCGLRELAERGATRVALQVDSENLTGAVGLYRRAGFEVTNERRIYRLRLGTGDCSSAVRTRAATSSGL